MELLRVKVISVSWIALLAVVGASVLTAWFVCRHLILPAGALGWDECAHALYGLLNQYGRSPGSAGVAVEV